MDAIVFTVRGVPFYNMDLSALIYIVGNSSIKVAGEDTQLIETWAKARRVIDSPAVTPK